MPPQGSDGFTQNWDEIEAVNKDLIALREVTAASAKPYANARAEKEHFGRVEGSATAGESAVAIKSQLSEALTDAAQFLEQFTAKVEAAVKKHQENDEAARDRYAKLAKDVD